MEEDYVPTLYDISELSRDFGLVGERDTHLVVFLSFLKGGFVTMTGLSRGGKDFVVDAANYCMPDDEVFKVPTSTSKVALYEKMDMMNNARVHRYPDIATLDNKAHLEEIMKAHGEGNNITHERAKGAQGGTESFTLTPPDCFVMFVASDNEQVDLNDFPELRNRALTVSIDSSQELTEKVNTAQARKMSGLYEPNYTPEEREQIREYVDGIPVKMYASDNGPNGSTFALPGFALDNQNPLPQHFTEARQDFPRLMKFVRAVTMFHYEDRMEVALEDREESVSLLITPVDVWYGMRIFGEQMVLSALNLRDKDFEMLGLIRDSDGGLSKAEIQMQMRDEGFNITNRDVSSALNNMLTKGYVRKDQAESPVLWAAAPFASNATREVTMDWSELVEDTKEIAREVLPVDVAEEYIERFCEGDGLFVTHPFTGERMNITKQNLLEEAVNEAEEEENDVFSDDLYGSDNDQSQGTLG
jgi:hypothetical protein